MKEYDVVVIGSGPGGYVSAIRNAQLGKSVAIIEKYSTLGGTCLNVGCIPSKAMLDSAEKVYEANEHFQDHGIGIGGDKVNIDFSKLMGRVQNVVSDTCNGVSYLMKKNKIDVYEGLGSFVDAHTVKIEGKDSGEIKAKNIIIATGSKPSTLPGIEIDKKRIITSTEALKLEEIPKKMIVIGGGVIGLELGSVYAKLGSEVSVVEFADAVIAAMDQEISKVMKRALESQGVKFYLGHAVTEVKTKKNGVEVIAKKRKDDSELKLDGDYCLVCVGRSPYTQGLNLEAAGLSTDDRGRIAVNEHLQTSQSHIYAIGDVVRGAMLAHKAEEEGVYVAELLNGEKPHIDYNLVPGVVYTHPEAASVGKTEQELKADGVKFKKGSFPFKASGRARASNESIGFVKVLADASTDEILGVHMIGPRSSDMIAQAVTAMEYRASAEDIARVCHAHPTYTESFKEACLAATEDRALHI